MAYNRQVEEEELQLMRYAEYEDRFLNEVKDTFDLKITFRNSDLDFDPAYMTTAKKDVILRKLEDPDYAEAWRINYSRVFYNDLKTRLLNNSNFFFRFYGDPNSGKSFASLYIAYLTTLLGFKYVNLFSISNAELVMAQNAYNLSKGKGGTLKKILLNVDETQQKWGVGSKASTTYFQQLTEFMRAFQICITIVNPNDTSNADIQLETIGYTEPNDEGIRYTKSILHYLIDKRLSIYKPIGYILTKTPPKNFIDAYLVQKEEFLKNFSTIRNPNYERDDTLCEMVWNDMPQERKELLRQALLLNKENYVQSILRKEFSVFNLPTAEIKELMEAFKLKYFEKEIKAGWERKLAQIENKLAKAKV